MIIIPNTIYNVDCVLGMNAMRDAGVDLIVTSPPYDSIRDYQGYSFDYKSVGDSAFRILKNGSFFCMVIQDGTKNFAKSCTTYRVILDYVDRIGFKLFENVIYSKNGRPGAWWNKRFRVDHEYILIFLKGERPAYFDKTSIMIPSIHGGEKFHGTQRLTNGEKIPIKKTLQGTMKCRGTIWKYNTSNTESREKTLHPATFPDKLAEDLIVTFSDVNAIVLDPFMGSGTTARMAKKNGRQFIGFDLSKEYCDLAERLIENESMG